MLASIISSKRRWSEMLAFSNDYYGFIFRVTQSVELFCTYVYSIKSLWNLNKNFIYLTNGISILNRDRRESAPPVLIPSVNDNFDSKIYDITWKEHLIFLYYHKPFLKFAIKYWIYLLSTIIIWNWFWK